MVDQGMGIEEAAKRVLTLTRKLVEVRAHERLKNSYATPFRDLVPPETDPLEALAKIRAGVLGVYDWQVEFHNAGAKSPERCLMAANRVGKTESGAAEVALHATGEYPEWWKGRRFDGPVRIWVGSKTNEASRDIVQAKLLGGVKADELGTGFIPKRSIDPQGITMRQCGIADVVDTIRVKHKSGGWSTITFKSYEQGWEKWQGTSQHVVWFDEEPPMKVYTEGLTRTIDVQGIAILTYTPLEGVTDVVQHFLDGGDGIFIIGAGWDDAPHLAPEERRRLAASYPEHERDTRTKGIPLMGSGAIFAVKDEAIMVEPFEIPRHYRRICGIDFGFGHPAAAAWMAYNGDSDTIIVYDAWRESGANAATHASAINARGEWIPVAWPHDGLQSEKGTGKPLADLYRNLHVNMLVNSARYDDQKGGGQPMEPIVIDILERMQTGRFKVFSNLRQWFEEKRFYHRKDGKIVPVRDDLLKATQYGVMMLRYAITPIELNDRQYSTSGAEYDPLGDYR